MKDAISKDKLLEGIKNIDILYVYIKCDSPSRHIKIGGIDVIEFAEGVTAIPDEVYYWENGTDKEVRARLYEYIQSMFNAMPNCYIHEYKYNRRRYKMTLKEVLEKYEKEQPDLKLNINYLDENKTLLFTLVEETATNILKDESKTNYLDSKVFDYKDNVINVYYDNPVIIL